MHFFLQKHLTSPLTWIMRRNLGRVNIIYTHTVIYIGKAWEGDTKSLFYILIVLTVTLPVRERERWVDQMFILWVRLHTVITSNTRFIKWPEPKDMRLQTYENMIPTEKYEERAGKKTKTPTSIWYKLESQKSLLVSELSIEGCNIEDLSLCSVFLQKELSNNLPALKWLLGFLCLHRYQHSKLPNNTGKAY